MQADGGLAAARATLDDHHARLSRGHDLELAWVDQGRDLGQVAIQALLVLARRAQHPAAGNGARGHRLAARQLAQGHIRAPPERPRRIRGRPSLDPDPLRASDAQQFRFLNRDRAAEQDIAFHRAIAEGFLVVAALGVSVVELADRGVAPVDDADARARVGEGGAADEDIALDLAPPGHALAQSQVGEVRRTRVDQNVSQVGAGQGNLLEPLHLRHQGRHVLQARLADLVAQGHQVGIHVARPGHARGRCFHRRGVSQAARNPRQEFFLLRRDLAVVGLALIVHGRDEL